MDATIKDAKTHNNPKDPYKIAYIIYFILGAGNLLPWNALITAVDYFGYLYPNKHVEKVFSVVYMTSSLAVLCVFLVWEKCRKRISLRLRMSMGFCMFILPLMATPIMHWAWHDVSYYMVVVSVLTCGVADGIIGGSLIGSAGLLPKQYMQAVFAGTASSGVLISILRIITKASLPQTPQGLKTSAQFYFIVSSAFIITCIISSNLLYKLPLMHQHNYHNLPIHNLSTPKFWQTFTKIKFPCFGIFMIYAVTLSIFPGFLAENIKSNLLKDWYPIMVIAMYNVSDFLGKSLPAIYVMSDNNIGNVTWGCVARVLFCPMFIGCFRGPEWLRTEAPVVVLTVMLGFSNGYLTSVIMMLAPKTVPQAEAEVAAIVMALLLGMGLVCGSIMSWFWVI